MLSQRVQGIGFSATLRIAARAQKLMEEGRSVIDLSVGEPDFPTPAFIKEAAKRALDQEATKYTENEGILPLREAIGLKYQGETGAHYAPDEVIVSTGAKQCLYNALMALINEGDEVLIPAPYWVSYTHMVRLAKGVPVIIPTREEEGFRLTADALSRHITPRTRLLILNNPCNPTGTAYSADHLHPLTDICLEEGIFIISDEIYEKLVYDGFPFVSLAALGERVRRQSVIVNGFSKSYAMTGWRLGYAVGPREVIEAMGKIQSHSTSNPTAVSQWAGVAALTGTQTEMLRMRDEFERRRNLALYEISRIPHLSCRKPEGAFYLFLNTSWYHQTHFQGIPIRNSAGLAYYLLKEAQIAVVPGESFGDDNYIRISYATSAEKLREGLQRLARALAELKPIPAAARTRIQNTVTKVKDFVPLQAPLSGEEREKLLHEVHQAIPFDQYQEWNANIGGVVIKLITNSPHLIDFWMENWYPAPLESDLESHGVIYGVKEIPGREASAYWCPENRSAFFFNSAFYPQVRRLALGLVDDFVARVGSGAIIGGACVDVEGKGVALIAPPGAGGGTHLGTLWRHRESKIHSFHGFLLRWVNGEPIADSLERKFLIPTDLAEHIPELERILERSKLENGVTQRDECQRSACPVSEKCPLERGGEVCFIASSTSQGIIDPYWLGGPQRHTKRTTLRHIILLVRDPVGEGMVTLTPEKGVKLLEEGLIASPRRGYARQPFYNPYHMTLTTDRWEQLRQLWRRLLSVAPLTLLNTERLSPAQTQDLIYRIIDQT